MEAASGGAPSGGAAAGPAAAGGEGDEPTAVLRVLAADSVIRTDTLEVRDGLNRATWNLRPDGFETPGEGEGGAGPGGDRVPAPQVTSGTYTLQLALEGDTVSGPVEVRFDPRLEVPASGRRAKRQAMLRAGGHFETAAAAVERIRGAKKDVDRVVEMATEQELASADSLEAAATRLKEALTAAEEAFVGPTGEVQGIVREQESVTARLERAYSSLSSSFDAPTEAQRRLLRHAEGRLEKAVERTNRVFSEDVAEFRGQVREAGLEFFPEKEPLEAGV
jgi:exonuclease VII small subunit